MINNFRGKYYFLSNFYSAPVKYDGISYQNNEAAFQAAKCMSRDKRIAFSTLLPNEAKKLGRKISLRPDWEEVKFNVMREIVHEKFTQNPDLLERLLATNDAELIEGNTWHDNLYGDCSCPKCQAIEGKNMLGKILMDERKIQKEKRA